VLPFLSEKTVDTAPADALAAEVSGIAENRSRANAPLRAAVFR
jgi:hypothetical protein